MLYLEKNAGKENISHNINYSKREIMCYRGGLHSAVWNLSWVLAFAVILTFWPDATGKWLSLWGLSGKSSVWYAKHWMKISLNKIFTAFLKFQVTDFFPAILPPLSHPTHSTCLVLLHSGARVIDPSGNSILAEDTKLISIWSVKHG